MRSPASILSVHRFEIYLTVGFIDTAEAGVQSEIYYTPVIDTSGFWKLNSMSAVVNGQVVERSGNTAIADTGTTLCLVDSALCEAIYKAIPGSKYAILVKYLIKGMTVGTPDGFSLLAILRKSCLLCLLELVIRIPEGVK